jgi:hypothetical protein
MREAMEKGNPFVRRFIIRHWREQRRLTGELKNGFPPDAENVPEDLKNRELGGESEMNSKSFTVLENDTDPVETKRLKK